MARCYETEGDRAAAWRQRWSVASSGPTAEDAALASIVAGNNERQRLREEAAQRQENERLAKLAERERREDERAQKEQAREIRSADVARMATDKAHAVPAISAIMCSINAEMADDRSRLEREKRVAAIGGAASLRDRHELSSELVDDSDELRIWRAALRRFGGSQLPCKELQGIISCREKDLRDCDDASRDVAAVWFEQFETLWGPSAPQPHRGR